MIRHIARLSLALGALGALAACSDYQHNPTAPGPPPTPTTVDVSFCNGAEPQWVAFQDGDGAWTRAQPVINGQLATFSHAFTANRGAIATERQSAGGFTFLSVQYGALDELPIAGEARTDLCAAPALITLLGTVTGIDTNEVAVVSDRRSTREATTPAEGGEYILRFVPNGPQELFATRLTDTGDDLLLTGYILRHGPALPDGATIPVLDFSSAEVIQPAVRTLTLEGFGIDGAISSVGFRTAHSDNIATFGNSSIVAKDRTYFAVPEDRLAPGDLQFLSAHTNLSNTSNVVRSMFTYFRAPVDRTMTFPALPHAPQVSVIATMPSVRLRARFDTQADYNRATGIHYQQGFNVVALNMLPGYAALNAGGYELVVPELTGVAGFDPRWGLQQGVVAIWQTSRIGGTLGLAPGTVPADGDTRVIGTDGGFVTP
jgi:hypothetical protein